MNWIDITIIVMLGIFSIIGFAKGFTHRVLSLISWGGSILLSFKLYPMLRPLVAQHIASGTVASFLTGFVLFALLLFAFKALTNAISSLIKKSPFGGLDRLLGVFFGFIMGFLILSLVAIILNVFVSRQHYPQAMRTSKLWPYVMQGQGYIEDLSPLKKKSFNKGDLMKKVESAKKIPKKLLDNTGYNKNERSQLTHLIEEVGG